MCEGFKLINKSFRTVNTIKIKLYANLMIKDYLLKLADFIKE